MSTTRSWGMRAVVWALLGVAAAGAARAADDSQRFLDALRENGYHDTAIEFLEMVRSTGQGTQEFRETLDYELGVTLIESSLLGRSMSLREKSLGDARAQLDKFMAEHGQHPLVPSAKRLLADVLCKRAQIKVELGDQPNKSPDDTKKLLEEARALYVEAQKVFDTLEKAALDPLAKMPKVVAAGTPEKDKQEQLQRDLLEARLAQATVLYQIAQTYPKGSQGYKDNLAASAKKYNDFYSKYQPRLAAYYARMWEGRSYREMGEARKALGIFEELMAGEEGEPESFRVMRNKTRVLALEAALDPSVKKCKEAVLMYNDWLSRARRDEENSVEGLAIHYLAGEAALEHARSLKEGDKERREHLAKANSAFKYAVRFPGEYQAKARSKLQDPLLGGERGAEPTNFAEARDRAKETLDRMVELQTTRDLDKAQGKTVGLDKMEEEINEQRDNALKYFQMALRMAPSETPIDDINQIRYYVTYLYYATDQLPEAAVIGEFLARRYPNSVGGKTGARIAMACWARMLSEGGPDKAYESQRLVEVAEYIAARWAGQTEADLAWMTLIGTAVRNRDLKTAQEYLAKIPEDAGKRGEAEQAVGQLIWSKYLEAMKMEDAERPAEAELETMKALAEKVLEDGMARIKKAGNDPTTSTTASVLYLSQIYVETGQAEKAVALLDDPKYGAKTLVDRNDPVTQREGFAVETLRLALRAYVATQQLDKAEAAMAKLEKVVGEKGDAEASRKLTQIYIRLGKELEDQLDRLRKEHKNEQVAKVTQGFELFLTKILQRDKGNNFNSLYWVATTFTGLGDGFNTGVGKLSPQAEGYYQKAFDSYQKILERLNEPDFGAPENVANSVKIRQAKVLRHMGEHSKAIAQLLSVLREKQTVVDAQVEAAYTLQEMGADKDPKFYAMAISGSTKQKEIWGWGQLARKVQTVKGFEDTFHEARYNLALCRFKHSQAPEASAAEKSKLLDQAEKDVEIMFKLYPEMGGPKWFDKYDSLLKSIQKLKGGKATGIEGLKAAAEAAKKAEAAKTAAK